MATPLDQIPTEAVTQPLEVPTEFYRQVIAQLLTEQSPLSPRYGKFEQQVIIDREHDHYLLLSLGWNLDETKREYRVVFHMDIIDGKIWIQQNQTELLVEQILVQRGVPPEAIVLGMLPTYSRRHSGFNVG